MVQESKPVDLKEEFDWINEHMDRMFHGVHDRLSRLEEGDISKMSLRLSDLMSVIKEIEQTVSECKDNLFELTVQISSLEETIKLATSR